MTGGRADGDDGGEGDSERRPVLARSAAGLAAASLEVSRLAAAAASARATCAWIAFA